ncbi:helix-turn-helix domain-containing protein [Paenibacillus albus]|uniref:AraC family transcriptional regulator n=1 Tax=Paenibacillus albus TaxID=2495582 RepID=A0A3Q8X3V7_9BACL|nr:AraC family transcriptional regulator [Paenibacillus albus]AZN38330.1 AraC family transcriptional regulator [Paenibacillus albus]
MNGKLDFFYYSTYESDTYVDFHNHQCFELVYYADGYGQMNLNGSLLDYVPGSMTLTRPLYTHDERHDAPTEVLFFGFSYDDYPISLVNGLYYDNEDKEMLKLLTRMRAELIGGKPHYMERLNLMVNEAIILLARFDSAGATKREKDTAADKLFFARRYMDENFSRPINIRTMSELAGYSQDHFRHLFKEVTGTSPGNYLLRRRLEHSRILLLSTELTVSDIGADCGFSTTSQFIQLFKQHLGATPLQYRIMQRKE